MGTLFGEGDVNMEDGRMTKQIGNNIELVSDMISRYSDEWIFFEVVEYDQYERPCKGILRAHHPDRDKIHEIVMRTDRKHFAVWYTGRIELH
jgi:hypothetical protein